MAQIPMCNRDTTVIAGGASQVALMHSINLTPLLDEVSMRNRDDSGPSEHLASRSSLRAQVTAVTDETLLASGWQRFFDSSTGKAYYRNGTTDVTQWELPAIPLDSRSTMQRWCDAIKGDPRPCFFWDSTE